MPQLSSQSRKMNQVWEETIPPEPRQLCRPKFSWQACSSPGTQSILRQSVLGLIRGCALQSTEPAELPARCQHIFFDQGSGKSQDLDEFTENQGEGKAWQQHWHAGGVRGPTHARLLSLFL